MSNVVVDPNRFDWSDLLYHLIESVKHREPALVKWCVGSATQIKTATGTTVKVNKSVECIRSLFSDLLFYIFHKALNNDIQEK